MEARIMLIVTVTNAESPVPMVSRKLSVVPAPEIYEHNIAAKLFTK